MAAACDQTIFLRVARQPAAHSAGDGWRPTGSNRVIRGGSWNNNARNCRSANRNNDNPDNRNNNLGFRAVLPPAQSRDAGLTRPPSCPWSRCSGAKSGAKRPGVSSKAAPSRKLRACGFHRRVVEGPVPRVHRWMESLALRAPLDCRPKPCRRCRTPPARRLAFSLNWPLRNLGGSKCSGQSPVTEQFGVTRVVAVTENGVGRVLGPVDSSAPPSSVFSQPLNIKLMAVLLAFGTVYSAARICSNS
jgi:hypothetical protein